MKKIIQYEKGTVLREKAKEVPLEDIGSKKIQDLLKEMSDSLAIHDDGVALAAPQIGVSLRIFIVSTKAFPDQKNQKELVFINPIVKKSSQKKIRMEEGCLSVRWLYGETRRADKITVEAYNEKGHRFVKTGEDLLAQIFQHEIDHLDGVLFIDKARNIQEIRPEDQNGQPEI